MPDLGQYTDTVLAAYVIGLLLLIALTSMSVFRANKIKKQLSELEKGRKRHG